MSRVDEDKRIVREIEFQSIGGSQFFRELNYDLKFRHRNDEFNFQFLKFNRANVDSWSERPHFACSLFS